MTLALRHPDQPSAACIALGVDALALLVHGSGHPIHDRLPFEADMIFFVVTVVLAVAVVVAADP
jgi:hypothetical protein